MATKRSEVRVLTRAQWSAHLDELAQKANYTTARALVKAMHEHTAVASQPQQTLAFLVGCNPDYAYDCGCECTKTLEEHHF